MTLVYSNVSPSDRVTNKLNEQSHTWKNTYRPNRAQLAIIGNIAASLCDIVSGRSPPS